MDGRHEIASEFVVSSGDAAEVLEATEAALDDVSSLVGALVEGMDDDAVGFVGNDGLCPALDDLGAQFVAVISFVAKQGAHGRGECQNLRGGSDVGVLASRQMKNDRSAARIAQAMDFGRSPTARAPDGLILLPPFPPEAQR